MQYALLWCLVLTMCGWLSWPLTAVLAKDSPLRGLGIAQVLGLTLGGYLYWAVGHLIETRHALWLSAAMLAAGGFLAWRADRGLQSWLKRHWRRAALFQVVVALAFLALALCRRGFPDIAHTEQPMNLAMLSGVIHADRMPPQDLWLAGKSISYYYLGYVLWGWLAALTRTPLGIAYNLALGGVGMLAWAALSELIMLLSPRNGSDRRMLTGGALGASAVLSSSNLAGLVLVGRSLGLVGDRLARATGIPDLTWLPLGVFPPRQHWWWWQASRVSRDATLLGRPSDVISEFPAFSWLLGDLHPHYMALPLSIAAAGLVLMVARALRRAEMPWRGVLLTGWLIGSAGFCSAWELPLLTGLTVAVWFVSARASGAWQRCLTCLLLAALAALLPFLPYWLRFDSQATGLAANWMARSRLRTLVLVMGIWLPPLLLVQAKRRTTRWYLVLFALALALACLVTLAVGGWGRMILSLASTIIQGLPVTLLLAGLWAWLAARLIERLIRWPDDSLIPGLWLALGGASLLYAAEYVRMGDQFGTRMNTFFKLAYQSWWLLGAGAVAAVASSLDDRWRRRVGLACAVVVVLSTSYLALGVATRAVSEEGGTLDGLARVRAENPDELAVAVWLAEHSAPDDVLLVATGRSYYPEDTRLAAISGVPMVLGWQGHEEQWHSSAAEVRARAADIDRFYGKTSDAERLEIVTRRGVSYALVGPRERSAYDLGAREVEGIATLCPLAVEHGEWALFDCSPEQENHP